MKISIEGARNIVSETEKSWGEGLNALGIYLLDFYIPFSVFGIILLFFGNKTNLITKTDYSQDSQAFMANGEPNVFYFCFHFNCFTLIFTL